MKRLYEKGGDTKTIDAQRLHDITVQYMTDEERYETECLDTNQAIAHFIACFGEERWEEISNS